MRVESPAGSKKTTGAEGRKSDVIASEIILNAKQATVRQTKTRGAEKGNSFSISFCTGGVHYPHVQRVESDTARIYIGKTKRRLLERRTGHFKAITSSCLAPAVNFCQVNLSH